MYRRLPRLALNYLGGSRLCSTQAVQERIANLVKENKVVVFMKGTPEQPMCGFSRAVAQILEMHEVGRENITTHDVLEDDSIRSGIKEFSSWPTVPQVYIQGEFVGGCDIMLELHKSGDLIEHLKEVGIKSALDVEEDS